jgi:hypothetical protein
VKATPDQHDADWPKYPETILNFATEPPFSIDLRAVIAPPDIAALARAGLAETFAVITAFDPRGRNVSAEENETLSRRLEARLDELGQKFVPVDACSPDGKHCEGSVAVQMAKEDAVSVAVEFDQVAIFWFDGSQFWIVGALLPTDPVMLPRSS